MAHSLPLKRGDLRDALVAYARNETDCGCIDSMSLRAAARDLGVSSGAVYRHFEDKDALLKEVVHLGFLELREVFLSIRPEDAPARDATEAVARSFEMNRRFVDFAQRCPAMWRMMFGRIGVMCREDHMKDPELTRYTIMDAVHQNALDLWRFGVLDREPDLSDVRFIWSAIHGAADLAQSGARYDGDDIVSVADQTAERSLRALGCRAEAIEAGRPPRTTHP